MAERGDVVSEDVIINQTTNTLTGIISLPSAKIIGIIMPAAWTAASLTFQGSVDGVNFFDVYDKAGDEVVIVAAASRWIRLDFTDWMGFEYMKIRSGTGATPVQQGAARTLVLAKLF